MALGAMGTKFYFKSSSGSEVTVGKLSSIGELAPSSEELEITTLASTSREYMQGIKSAGELELEGFFDPEDAGQTALRAAYESGETGTARIVFADGTEFSFSAYVSGYGIGATEVDGAVGFTAKMRLTGGITMKGAGT